MVVVLAVVYWLYLEDDSSMTVQEQACVNSGGILSNYFCCLSTDDFPNSCLVGACGCSPGNSHEVETCDCGENMCFDGTSCVER